MHVGVGEFATAGLPLASIAAEQCRAELEDRVRGMYRLASYRTIHQDAAFGVRQLVDIATRALSPSTNDSTTAITCVQYLSVVLVKMARRKVPSPARRVEGKVRLIARGATLEKLLALAFDEIRRAARNNLRVLESLACSLEQVSSAVPNGPRRAHVRAQVIRVRDALRADAAFDGEGTEGLTTCARVLAGMPDAPKLRIDTRAPKNFASAMRYQAATVACLASEVGMRSQQTAPSSRMRRWRALLRLEKWLEPAMVGLGLTWLVLLIIEFIWGLAPWLAHLSTVIWIVFLIDFTIRFALAPKKRIFLARNWMTIISLALPAFRVLRFARALRLARATRGLKLVRLLTSANRGIRSLGAALGARGAGYVAALTAVVILAGAAGMLVFEGTASPRAFTGYTEALWWTAMLVTTIGPEFWPKTAEGRVLMLLLSIYAVGVFGYLAAALASVLIGGAAARQKPGQQDETIAALGIEVRKLRAEIAALSAAREP